MSEEKIDLWADQTASVEAPQEIPSEVEQVAESLPEVTEEVVPEVVETPETVIEPVVQEKIVEKIIEKAPEFKDDYSRQIYESLLNGSTDEVYKYLQEKNRDYQTMSDYDVVKEGLKLSNPKWTEKDIQIELKSKYGTIPERKDLSQIDADLDRDEYNEAVAFNNRIDEKELLLSRDARDFRYTLEEQKKTIELPKISKAEAAAEQPSAEAIEEANRMWEAKVSTEIPKMSDIRFKIGNEEVTYKITDAEKKESLDYMKNFNAEQWAIDRGWVDAEGNENILKIAEDRLKLEYFERIQASAGTKIKTDNKKELIADIKNIDLKRSTQSPELNVDLGAKIWG